MKKPIKCLALQDLSRLGVRPVVKSACLNHTPQDVTSRLRQVSYSPEKKAAFSAWAEHVESVLN